MKTQYPQPSRRTILPRLLNLVLWLSFCAMTGTGLQLAFRLPPGSQGGRGLSALGLGRHEWGDWHTWIGYVFIFSIFLHVALHWRWLWQVASRKRLWPMVAGIGLGFVTVLILVFQPVENQSSKTEGSHKHQNRQKATK